MSRSIPSVGVGDGSTIVYLSHDPCMALANEFENPEKKREKNQIILSVVTPFFIMFAIIPTSSFPLSLSDQGKTNSVPLRLFLTAFSETWNLDTCARNLDGSVGIP